MKASELEELGFVYESINKVMCLVTGVGVEIVVWDYDTYVTIYPNEIYALELHNVNTIEKVKQLIELLK